MTEPVYKIVDVNESNLDKYDLFCKKSKKREIGYQNKVEWIKDRFREGLHLKLLMIKESKGYTSRGFIEYIPGDYTWRGIDAKDYMVVHCLWVVGKNKNKGYGKKLLEECFKDAEGMSGVAVVTTDTHWLSKNKIFIKNGFEKADEYPPSFELYVKRFSESAPLPKFYPFSKKVDSPGITVLYSPQCPYIPDAIKIVEEVAKKANIPFKAESITDCRAAQQNGFHPYGTYCVLLNGEILTYKYGKEKEIVKLLNEKGMNVKIT